MQRPDFLDLLHDRSYVVKAGNYDPFAVDNTLNVRIALDKKRAGLCVFIDINLCDILKRTYKP